MGEKDKVVKEEAISDKIEMPDKDLVLKSINILDRATSLITVNRADHVAILNALSVLRQLSSSVYFKYSA